MKLGGLRDERRAVATAVCGGVGIVLACLGIVSHFESVMVYLGIAITPLCGVMIADYWWVRRARPEQWRPVPGWSVPGLVAAGVGAAVALLVERVSATGLAPWAAAWLIPSVVGVVVAAVLYPPLHAAVGRREADEHVGVSAG